MGQDHDGSGHIDLTIWRGPARIEAMATVHRVPAKDVERAAVAAGWHVDPWLTAWPPGEIEAYLQQYPDRAAARDESLNAGLRAVGLPETRLYRDILERMNGGN